MSTCPILLQFLGFHVDAAKEYSKRRTEYVKQQSTGKRSVRMLCKDIPVV